MNDPAAAHPRDSAQLRWVLSQELTGLRNRHLRAQRFLQSLGREPTLIEVLDIVLSESPFRDAIADAVNAAGNPQPYTEAMPDTMVMGVIGMLELAFVGQVMLTCSEFANYRMVCSALTATLTLQSGASIGLGVSPDPDALVKLMGEQGIDLMGGDGTAPEGASRG
jgi:hypothetical protein